MSEIDRDKLTEWIDNNTQNDWLEGYDDFCDYVSTEDLMLAINNGELDKPESEE